MPDLFALLKKWWKQITGLMVLALLTAGLIVYLQPLQYLSTATALPASSFAADRSRIFNKNLQELYSDLGTPEDLDMVVGTAQLDTVFLSVTDSFNLYDHYGNKGPQKRRNAAERLKKNSRIYKSDYGELKVKVWDTDRELAPQLANSLMEILQEIHSRARNAGNQATIDALKMAMKKESDSLHGAPISAERKAEYQQLIDQFEVMVDSKTPSLVIIENARAAIRPDRPRRPEILIATAILSFLFGILGALVLDRKKAGVESDH